MKLRHHWHNLVTRIRLRFWRIVDALDFWFNDWNPF